MEERSAGAVVFFEGTGERRYLLLRYPAGHWDFPKGNIEQGEGLMDTVKREIWEETGLKSISRIGDFKKSVEYFYQRNGRKVHKEVIFLLIKSFDNKVKLSFEHQNYGWFKFNEAVKVVTYSNSKRILIEAEKFLDSDLSKLESASETRAPF
jgi:8-oxo-dGTP pyrophosphatase MutT (NUDIX family)